MAERLRVAIAGYGVVGRRRRLFIDQQSRLQTVAVCDQKFAGTQAEADGVDSASVIQGILDGVGVP